MVGIINTNKMGVHHNDVTVAAPISPTNIIHSATDDGDFSGVVDGPALKVKDIRSRFKNRDFEAYSKPKPMNQSSIDRRPNPVTNNQQQTVPKRNSYMSSSSSRSSCSENDFPNPIAQDVMSLFQIVDAEKDLNAVFDDLQLQQQPQQKKKVPPPVPPKRTHSSAESVKTKRDSLRRSVDITDSFPAPPQPEVESAEDIKTKVEQIKAESQKVETLEESLDDFYSLLDSY